MLRSLALHIYLMNIKEDLGLSENEAAGFIGPEASAVIRLNW